MAIYTQPKMRTEDSYFGGRTDSYRFTITSKDDQSLLNLKAGVAEHNKRVRARVRSGEHTLKTYQNSYGLSLQRVSLMARGARRGTDGKALHRNCDSNLNHKFATHFDVYIHDDTANNYQLQRELDTGLTPGQLKALDRADRAKWQLSMEIDAELSKQGIVATFGDSGKEYISREKLAERLRAEGVNESIIERIVK